MKNYILLFLLILITSCGSPSDCNPSNGFGPVEGQKVFMGSEKTLEVFNLIDEAWAKRDYDVLKSLISDNGNYTFSDGTNVTTAEEFVDKIEESYQQSIEKGQDWGWNVDFAFSVYPKGSSDGSSPNEKGEWVNAQFTSPDGVYLEWYQIAEGQLISWFSAKNPGNTE